MNWRTAGTQKWPTHMHYLYLQPGCQSFSPPAWSQKHTLVGVPDSPQATAAALCQAGGRTHGTRAPRVPAAGCVQHNMSTSPQSRLSLAAFVHGAALARWWASSIQAPPCTLAHSARHCEAAAASHGTQHDGHLDPLHSSHVIRRPQRLLTVMQGPSSHISSGVHPVLPAALRAMFMTCDLAAHTRVKLLVRKHGAQPPAANGLGAA